MSERQDGTLDAESRAIRNAAAVNEQLERAYGRVPPVVYFLQRRPDGPVKIGAASRLVGRFEAFYRASPDLIIVRAVIPGGQPLEHWFHARHASVRVFGEWYEPGPVIREAADFARRHRDAYEGDLTLATVSVLREFDPVLADIERLYRNGTPATRIAVMAGLSQGELRARLDKMRALGFDVHPRLAFAPRARQVSR